MKPISPSASQVPARPLTSATIEQVWELLAQQVRPLLGEEQLRLESADLAGRVLTQDVVCDGDYPPFDRAVVDGFAVRSADFGPDGARLRVIALSRAGNSHVPPLAGGACIQINTGAMIPAGADSVVMVEHSQPDGETHVRLTAAPRPGENIEKRGAIRRSGELLVRAGARLTAGRLASLAAAGPTEVRVHRLPRVAVLTTGDELVSPGQSRAAGQLRDANTLLLRGLLDRAGCSLTLLGRCPDERHALLERMREGLHHDLFCVSGGMSKGSHDLVPQLLQELGVSWLVESLNLKPGKPARVGRSVSGAWVLGLPGNPVSCGVCFLLMGRLILSALSGAPWKTPATVRGRLTAAIEANGKRPMFHPCRWTSADGSLVVEPLSWRGSGDPFGLADANGLIHRPGETPALDAGGEVLFFPLDVP